MIDRVASKDFHNSNFDNLVNIQAKPSFQRIIDSGDSLSTLLDGKLQQNVDAQASTIEELKNKVATLSKCLQLQKQKYEEVINKLKKNDQDKTAMIEKMGQKMKQIAEVI